LDELKARNGGASDYAIAKMLGITRSSVSKYRNKLGSFDDSVAIRVANLLEIDPAIVISSMHAERSRMPEERAIWEGIIERLGGVAAALALGVGLVSAPPQAEAAQAPISHNSMTNLHYVKSRKTRNRKNKTAKRPTFSELLFPGLFSHA
jgi:predicted transcriptional regulator